MAHSLLGKRLSSANDDDDDSWEYDQVGIVVFCTINTVQALLVNTRTFDLAMHGHALIC